MDIFSLLKLGNNIQPSKVKYIYIYTDGIKGVRLIVASEWQKKVKFSTLFIFPEIYC